MANAPRSVWDDISPEQLDEILAAAQPAPGPEVTFLGPVKVAEFRRRVRRQVIRTAALVLAFPVFSLVAACYISGYATTSVSVAAPPDQATMPDQSTPAPPDQPAPAPVFIPEMAFGDPDTLDDQLYEETIHFTGDPKVLEYNVKAASKNIVPGTVMWAERWPNGVVDVHLLMPNGGPRDTGIEFYNLRHEFYQCRQWGKPYAQETTLNPNQTLAGVEMPREMRYRAGSSKAAATGKDKP